ncbi:hypothetical protein NBRC3280_2789 [Acetobacter pasteurianus NBRC 3280]|uniref:Pentapeptide repeat-containing protein n=1 Tax=Acetobacter pasteurianus NBRC 3278 TaxID=1226660 RepID=A0A401X7M9_ACEPA|nr:pentapeptide repeat-containing protein [Acetobacter pasteurianus]QHM90166.1 pentapeptide repeat-containing protein [Acetobacter pasteurianus]GCD60172.1 hypothetical protein NBRC3277_2747 [Acetobacter pasteurianus NBRC 3277]GCD63870.1 hypothetical protein NBRC3278_2963 [Acetobacter pasteurianus NBRC 3278]GCD70154.1 hypothetical protein NBRC3280_2789 [Acetobacter pasteurianus NBRC 3280]
MTSQKRPFTISFVEGSDKAPIIDLEGKFESFSSFVSAHSQNLDFADLRWTNLSETDFSFGHLRHADLSYSKLDGCVFDHSVIDHALICSASATKLKGSNFSAKNLRAEYSDLSYSNLEDVDLSESALTGITLDEASFQRCNMNGSDLSSAHGVDTKFIELNLKGTSLSSSFFITPIFNECTFSTNKLKSSLEWKDARMHGAIWNRCTGHIPKLLMLEDTISKLSLTALSTGFLGMGTAVAASATLTSTTSLSVTPLYTTAALLVASGLSAITSLRASDSIWTRASRKFGGIIGRTARSVVKKTKDLFRKLQVTPSDQCKAEDRLNKILNDTYISLGNSKSIEAINAAFNSVNIGDHRDGFATSIVDDLISTYGTSSDILVCNSADMTKLSLAFSRLKSGQEFGNTVLVDPASLSARTGTSPALIKTSPGLIDICYVKDDSKGRPICTVAEYNKDGSLFGMTLTTDGETVRFKPDDPETKALCLPSLSKALSGMEASSLAPDINKEVDCKDGSYTLQEAELSETSPETITNAPFPA